MDGLRQAPVCWPRGRDPILARYTHRVAIANSRLVGLDEHAVTFKWKDYGTKGRTDYKTMTLAAHAMSSCVASYCRCCRPASTASPLRPARQCRAPRQSGQGARAAERTV
jgi:hypothetical protein